MDRIIDIKDKPIFDFIKFLMEHKKLNKYNDKPFETRYVVKNMNFSDLFIDKYIKHKDIKYISNDYEINSKYDKYIEWFDYGEMFDFFKNNIINEIERRVELFEEE